MIDHYTNIVNQVLNLILLQGAVSQLNTLATENPNIDVGDPNITASIFYIALQNERCLYVEREDDDDVMHRNFEFLSTEGFLLMARIVAASHTIRELYIHDSNLANHCLEIANILTSSPSRQKMVMTGCASIYELNPVQEVFSTHNAHVQEHNSRSHEILERLLPNDLVNTVGEYMDTTIECYVSLCGSMA